ncbi:MAG: hypothetical protein SVR08_01310 [Spirochaetota bacterium]|nr:hypothetical protein [Spirochaetota bacterium]
MDFIAIDLEEGDLIKIETYYLTIDIETVVFLYNSEHLEVAYNDDIYMMNGVYIQVS